MQINKYKNHKTYKGFIYSFFELICAFWKVLKFLSWFGSLKLFNPNNSHYFCDRYFLFLFTDVV